VTQQQAGERQVEPVPLGRDGGVTLDEGDLHPGRGGRSAGDRDGVAVRVDPDDPAGWSDEPGELDADLPVAAAEVETGRPGPGADPVRNAIVAAAMTPAWRASRSSSVCPPWMV
jgi:hypothetical protein